MDAVAHFFDDILVLVQSGFNQVNAYLGLAIALIASFQLSAWKKLWEMALVATLVHLAARVLAPVIDHGAPLQLPPLFQLTMWRNLLAVYIGYVLVIALFYFLRTKLLRPAAAHH